MTEWGTFGVIAALVAFVIAVVKPIINLNTSITKLSEAVKNLLRYVDKNDDCHAKFTETLSDHETRITVIEKSKGGD